MPDDDAAPTPPFWGTRISTEISLEEVWTYLNRAALIKGRWGYTRAGASKEEYATLIRDEVDPAIERLKTSAVAEGWLQPAVIHGWFPCRRNDEVLEVFAGPDDSKPTWRLEFPRQTKAPHRCLADWFRADSDVLGVSVVTMGSAASEYCARFMAADSYQEYLLAHGFAVECAEALAELWHKRMRREIGIHGADAENISDVIKGRYQGRRFSFGYPACPDLGQQAILADMLKWERLGIGLTEGFQLDPEQSTSAVMVHHPGAEYLNV
jgi:5-methyltetrahydrofolate--homocysteine methyltransferase